MDTRYQSLITKSIEFLKNQNLSISEKNNHYKNVGFYYYQLNIKQEALKWFLKINPIDLSTCKSIAAIYVDIGMLTEANTYTELCLQKKFEFDISYDLALHYTKKCIYHKALGIYETLMDIQPNNINVLNNVAEIYNCILEPNKAIECYLKAFELDKSRIDIYSNLIMTTYYIYKYSSNKRLEFTQKYENLLKPENVFYEVSQTPRAVSALRSILHSTPSRDIQRSIKIGYIGYDFDKLIHPISCFVKHIIENHDKTKFKVYCYQASDKISSCFQQQTNEELYTNKINGVITRDLSNFDNKSAANIIYDDKIDILVELMHHTAGNRLSILAYRPAPIQISYCAFPGTTGLSSIDYKILDNVTYTSRVKTFYTENIIHMNNGFHCYVPTYKFPSLKKRNIRQINFCCFNNLKKINEKVIENWLHILRLIPGSQLHLRYYQYTNSFVRELVKKRIEKVAKKLYIYKFDINRIHFIGYEPNYSNVLKIYEDMDIFLDTFPYTGTTVICEALYSGIPVITLLGKQPHERVCASLLSSINHPELIATNEKEYIEKAVMLGKNIQIIINYKNILSKDMRKSILGNSELFMTEYERKMKEVLTESG